MKKSEIWRYVIVVAASVGLTCLIALWAQHETRTKGISFDLGNGVKLEVVKIPAGRFGINPDVDGKLDNWSTPHSAEITKPFYLGKYEVTQEQWQAVMGFNPSEHKGPTKPVEMVSWEDCQEFLAKLNASVARGKGAFALPAVIQWEYACRAGSNSFRTDAAELSQYAWLSENSGCKTSPVGQKKPNELGLYDMLGNVWEWCEDWEGRTYFLLPIVDMTGESNGARRVACGGACNDTSCDPTDRDFRFPTFRSGKLGFRVMFVPVEKSK